jgi:hypothetical protein
MISGLATVVATERLASELLPASAVARVIPPLIVGFSPSFWVWSLSGMETTFYVFAITATLTSLVRSQNAARLSFWSPLWLLLVASTRTEGALLYGSALVVMLVLGLRGDRCYRLSNPRFIAWNMVFIVGFGAYVAARAVYYESLLPLPVLVKRPAGFQGLAYVGEFLLTFAPWLFLAGVSAAKGGRKYLVWNAFPLAFLVLYLCAFCLTNPIMGLHHRLVLAAIPSLLVLAARELANRKRGLAIAYVASLAGVALLARQGNEVLKTSSWPWDTLSTVHIPIGKTLAERGPAHASIALADAGAMAYFSGFTTIDFFGLNDPEFARDGFDAQRVIDRKPTYIVLKSDSAARFHGTDTDYGRQSDAIHALAEFQAEYSLFRVFTDPAPFYCLWVFERRP